MQLFVFVHGHRKAVQCSTQDKLFFALLWLDTYLCRQKSCSMQNFLCFADIAVCVEIIWYKSTCICWKVGCPVPLCRVVFYVEVVWYSCTCVCAGEYVAQFKATVILMPNGPLKITGLPFEPALYQTELKVEDEEVKVKPFLSLWLVNSWGQCCFWLPYMVVHAGQRWGFKESSLPKTFMWSRYMFLLHLQPTFCSS